MEKFRRNERVFDELYPALQVTNGCNKQCEGCLRSANSSSYRMSSAEVQKYLGDLRRLGDSYLIKYQFVTGGEPTIWKSGDMDTADMLVSLFNLNLIETISMPTNGRNFEDIHYARDFFKRISSAIDGKVVTGVSISSYQKNLSDSGYIAMDNLLTISSEPGMKVLPVLLVTLSSDDDTDRRLEKIYPGVRQRVVPLAPLGEAESLGELCPSLSLHGNDKRPLGSFYRHFKKEAFLKLGIGEDDFDSFPNAGLLDKFSLYAHCGESPFIDDRWHYCLPYKDDPEFDLCRVGEMREGTISDFLEGWGFLKCISEEGLLTAIEEHKIGLGKESREKLDYLFSPEVKISVAYRGCMVCKKFYDYGLLNELRSVTCGRDHE